MTSRATTNSPTRRRERPACHGCGAQPRTPLHPDLVDRVMRCTTCHCLVLDRRDHAAWLARRAVNGDWARQLTNRYAAAHRARRARTTPTGNGRHRLEPPPNGTPVQALAAAFDRLRAMARTRLPPAALDHLVLPATGHNPP